MSKKLQLLLAEDCESDAILTQEAIAEWKAPVDVHVAVDGVEALAFLRREGPYADAPRPDLVFLDLNMPRKSGHEVLAELRDDENLSMLPVIVLTSSDNPADIAESYRLHANCYITKPNRFADFVDAFRTIERFWIEIARLPPRR